MGIRLRDGEDFPYRETRGMPPEFVEAETHLCTRLPDGTPARDAENNLILACLCGDVLAERFDPKSPCFTSSGAFWTNHLTDYLAQSKESGRRYGCRNQRYESWR